MIVEALLSVCNPFSISEMLKFLLFYVDVFRVCFLYLQVLMYQKLVSQCVSFSMILLSKIGRVIGSLWSGVQNQCSQNNSYYSNYHKLLALSLGFPDEITEVVSVFFKNNTHTCVIRLLPPTSPPPFCFFYSYQSVANLLRQNAEFLLAELGISVWNIVY